MYYTYELTNVSMADGAIHINTHNFTEKHTTFIEGTFVCRS